ATGDMAETFSRLDACGADPKLIQFAKTCLSPDAKDRPRDGEVVRTAIVDYETELQRRLRSAEIDQAAARVKAEEERKRRMVSLRWAAVVIMFVILASVVGARLFIERDRMRQAARIELVRTAVLNALEDEEQEAKNAHERLSSEVKVQEFLSEPEVWRRS